MRQETLWPRHTHSGRVAVASLHVFAQVQVSGCCHVTLHGSCVAGIQFSGGPHKSQVFWQLRFFLSVYFAQRSFLHFSPSLSVHAGVHKPQVFRQLFFILSFLHFFLLHVSPALSVHAGALGGGDDSGGESGDGDGEGGGGGGSGEGEGSGGGGGGDGGGGDEGGRSTGAPNGQDSRQSIAPKGCCHLPAQHAVCVAYFTRSHPTAGLCGAVRGCAGLCCVVAPPPPPRASVCGAAHTHSEQPARRTTLPGACEYK